MQETERGKISRLSTPVDEAYKALRTNIRFCGAVSRIKTIAITSSTVGEGKTTTCINLARSMADAGMRTLLVELDLRKPALEKYLGMRRKAGITDYITGEVDLEDIIYSTGIKNLYITPCGTIPPNPAELLNSEKFSEFLDSVKDNYFISVKGQFDVVILDTPPLGNVIDAAIVASKADGTLLVIKSNAINYKLAQQVKAQLEKANANLLGVVINNVAKKELKYGYKYYYDYYNYYESDEEKKGKKFIPFKKIANLFFRQ